MRARAEAELPRHFGAAGELFGLYHPAAVPATKAVLLNPPFGQEQIRSHRLYRQLAQSLASQGIPVLRFDYYGSGDSAGASLDRDWDRCVADTLTATTELRLLSRCDRIIAFGARLGGSVAMAAATAARFDELILWDPILDGAAMVARLDALQLALQGDTRRFIAPRSASAVAGQWLGFAVSERFRQQLRGLQLDPPSIPTLLLDSQPPDAAADRNRVSAAATSIKTLSPSTSWDDLDRLEMAILSRELIQLTCNHLEATT